MTAFIRTHALAIFLLGLAFFGGSTGLMTAHVLKIRIMRDVGFPIAADVQPMLQRKAILAEQAEVAALQASARGSSYREIYDVYVLPEKPDVERSLATLETLLTYLQSQGVLMTIDSIAAGTADDSFADFTLTVTVPEGKGQAFLDMFDLSGVLTVNDAFTQSERAALIALTERENPTVIAAVEQFLSGDLLEYARVPQLAESRLLQSVGTDLFEADFHALVDGSRLRSFAQTALMLDDAKDSLWPLPILTVQHAHWERVGRGEQLTVTVRAHAKGGAVSAVVR